MALDKGILETDGATPESSINSQIITRIKKGAGLIFTVIVLWPQRIQ